MSFLSTSNKKLFHKNKKEKRFSLQTLKLKNKAYTDTNHNTYKCLKRMSIKLSFKISAGVTVEAAIAIPIFIFFMANLISIINIFNLYSEKLSKAQQIARAEAYMSCDVNHIGNELVKETQLMIISPYISNVGYKKEPTSVSMIYKKWTGYDLCNGENANQEEEYVYITEYGYTYHRNRGCSHLQISILVVNADEINQKRNNNGGKYYFCEKCGGRGTGVLFITAQGDRYHSSANCSGLKRNIKTVKLSDVGSRVPCSECGG